MEWVKMEHESRFTCQCISSTDLTCNIYIINIILHVCLMMQGFTSSNNYIATDWVSPDCMKLEGHTMGFQI